MSRYGTATVGNQRVKVSVAKLLERIRETAATEDAEYAKKLAEHQAVVAEWQKRTLYELDDYMTRIQTASYERLGEMFQPQGSSYHASFNSKDYFPRRPDKPDHQRAINILELATEDTISIRLDDMVFSRYL